MISETINELELKYSMTNDLAVEDAFHEAVEFVDLAPIDSADKDGTYSKALKFALDNPKVKNVAITGPYGSGKSSVINTFEKNNKLEYKFLNISLASFKDDITAKPAKGTGSEGGGTDPNFVETKVIEESILQQLLYGADAEKLLYSRFKRINTPTKANIKSATIVVYMMLLAFLFNDRYMLLKFDFNNIGWWLYAIFFAVSIGISFVVVKTIYHIFFGLSLRRVSLTTGEIEAENISDGSILNKYIDEIIYFFQQTDYDVVVFEDLDRFGDPEIFVKLREINFLVNNNSKVNRTVKFLYALKDDMFKNKNRAKFFDFIIPVVPVINSSNSLDKILERVKCKELNHLVNMDFLRDVSFFLDDMRLIHNIFNEFNIYYSKIGSKQMNVTSLLAVLIYKNVYPNDFELLHQGSGMLFSIIAKKEKLLSKLKQELDDDIINLEGQLSEIDKEESSSINELNLVYLANIFSQIGHDANAIRLDNNYYSMKQLLNPDLFKKLVQSKSRIEYRYGNGYGGSINETFRDLEKVINPTHSYFERVEIRKRKSSDFRSKAKLEIHAIKKKINDISTFKLMDLMKGNISVIDEIVGDSCERRLFSYLILNGYLDESYYLYTSNFHEGRMTKNDREFIITIRNFQKPDFNQLIDNIDEVIKNMREEDFSQIYFQNIHIFNEIILNETYSALYERAISWIHENQSDSEPFVLNYLATGKYVYKFLRSLYLRFPDYLIFVTESSNATSHILSAIQELELDFIIKTLNNELLRDFFRRNLEDVWVYSNIECSKFSLLKELLVNVDDLDVIKDRTELADYIYRNDLYEINVNNLLVLSAGLDASNFDEDAFRYSNFSYIRNLDDKLKCHIVNNLTLYFSKVLLTITTNTKESESSIHYLLSSKSVSEELKLKFLKMQECVMSDINQVPELFWEQQASSFKILGTWPNFSKVLNSDSVLDSSKVGLLESKPFRQELVSNKLSGLNLDERREISSFLDQQSELTIEAYSEVKRCLNLVYKKMVDVSLERLLFLAKERILTLNPDTFSDAESEELQYVLLKSNISIYLDDRNKYDVEQEIIQKLLESDLDIRDKRMLLNDVSSQYLEDKSGFATIVLEVASSDDASLGLLDKNLLKIAISKSKHTQLKVEVLCSTFGDWTMDEVMSFLSLFGHPYNSIPIKGRCPKLEHTRYNEVLSDLLKENRYISSISTNKGKITIYTFKK